MSQHITDLSAFVKQAGAFEYGVVDTADIEFSQEVRDMCAANTCRRYGATWACPPAIGTVEACRDKCRRYAHMLVFTHKCDLEDSFDYEGMMRGGEEFRHIVDAVDHALEQSWDGDYIMLGSAGCGRCTPAPCTYPDEPCRYPDKTHGSIEGQGIFVSTLAEQAGIHYINGQDTVTYFAAVLYNG